MSELSAKEAPVPRFIVKGDAEPQSFEVKMQTDKLNVNIFINDKRVAWLDGPAGKLRRMALSAETRKELEGLSFDTDGRIATD